MKLKAGDGDRTRDVQLGNMDAVCLSKTSLFNTFIQVYGIAPGVANGLFSSLNGINGVFQRAPRGEESSLYIKDDRSGSIPSSRKVLFAFLGETKQPVARERTNRYCVDCRACAIALVLLH